MARELTDNIEFEKGKLLDETLETQKPVNMLVPYVIGFVASLPIIVSAVNVYQGNYREATISGVGALVLWSLGFGARKLYDYVYSE